MYSFLLHSQVIRDTPQISTSLACPVVKLGKTTAVMIKERKSVSLVTVVLLGVTDGLAGSGEESGL